MNSLHIRILGLLPWSHFTL